MLRITISAAVLATCGGYFVADARAENVAAHQAVTLQQWTQRIEGEMGRNLRYPHMVGGRVRDGLVEVSFVAGEDGRPTSVAVTQTSGSAQLDAAAKRAISRIATLQPLPNGVGQGQVYKAQMIFATQHGFQQPAELQQRIAELQQKASENNIRWAARQSGSQETAAIMLVPTLTR